MAYATLHFDCRDSPATLTFNRPEKRNALSPEMIEELLAALDQEFTYTFGGCTIVRGLEESYLSQPVLSCKIA